MKRFKLEIYRDGKLKDIKEFDDFNLCYAFWDNEVSIFCNTKFYENGKYIAENPHKAYKRYCRW